MELIDFVFNILWYSGWFILDHPIISLGGLFLLLAASIIIRSAGGIRHVLNSPRKMSAAERAAILSKAHNNKNNTQTPTSNKKLECVNCGATLKAEYAVCEYCGMRNKWESDLPDDGVTYV